MSDTTASLGDLRTVAIDAVRPYWRNPRRVTEESVNMLVRSITEFGYQQPVVVDEEMVIIVGHTRYAALRRLKQTEIEVIVASHLSPEAVKQYRLIDNKVSELTSWDMEMLTTELAAIDNDLLVAFFPYITRDGDPDAAERAANDADDLQKEWDAVESRVDFVCPSCFHSWGQEVTRTDILAGRIALIDTRKKG